MLLVLRRLMTSAAVTIICLYGAVSCFARAQRVRAVGRVSQGI